MNERGWMLVTFAVVFLVMWGNATGFVRFLPESDDAAVEVVPPSDAPDMLAVFKVNPDRRERQQHAEIAAELFGSLARGIDFDESLGQVRIKRTSQLEDIRFLDSHYFLKGWSFGAMYPEFGVKVGAFLDARVGKDGEQELTQDLRNRWKQAYRDLELAVSVAKRKL